MNLGLNYGSTQGVEIILTVRASPSVLAGGDAAHLSPREAQDLIDAASERAMPKLANLFAAILQQVHSTLRQSCVDCLRNHATELKPDLHTDLAFVPAGITNQGREP